VTALLEAEGITKRFGGITALHNISLEVGGGEAVGLVGPNGAGKTTLFNCLLGVLAPDQGRVRFAGRDLRRLPVHRRARLGIGRTFQRMELFTEMTGREHLLVAERSRNRAGSLLKDLVNRGAPTAAEKRRVQTIVDLLGIADVADVPVESLSLGHGRLVELGRALATEATLLMLDEPSSGLDRTETQSLAGVLHQVQKERGTSILLVEHDLEMVCTVVHRLYVLDFGELLAQGPTTTVMADVGVRRAYLGESA
jgi:branched-chain amino acid transport system ATP-binding protein